MSAANIDLYAMLVSAGFQMCFFLISLGQIPRGSASKEKWSSNNTSTALLGNSLYLVIF
jgi:hypothetical protein